MHAVEVNLLARDDPPQAACADAFIGTSAWVSHWVLAEALWVPESVCGRTPAQLATALLLLLAHKRLSLQDADVALQRRFCIPNASLRWAFPIA